MKDTKRAVASATAVIKLSRAIADDEGQTWTELTVAEAELRHRVIAERKTTEMSEMIALFALLTGVPEAAIERLKTADARKIQKWMASDGRPAATLADNQGEDAQTFILSSPIVLDDRTITEITLREPDLAAGVAIEKFKGASQQTAATIAILSGLTIPVVHKLKMRDVTVIEGWLLPFVSDTGSPTGLAGETLQSNSAAV